MNKSIDPLNSPPKEQKRELFPPGTNNMFSFQFFNTASFSIVTSVPVILFFKEMGASVTILGIVNSLAPFLMILQIPASRHVEIIGYRRFVLNGWMLRTLFIIGLVIAALLPSSIDPSTRMFLSLFFLLGYNILRGISTAGFMPWISQLIPEKVRGRFLATDQMTTSISGLLTTLMISWWLQHHSGMHGFALVFLFAALSGFFSIRYLRKIPDLPVPEQSKSREPVPWKDLLSYKPFMRIIWINLVFNAALAGGALFWIPLLKDEFGKNSSYILYLLSIASLFAVIVQFSASRIIDRTGSRPAMSVGILFAVIHFLSWNLVASHLLPLNMMTALVIQLTAAIAFPLFNLANTRLIMTTVPTMGRSHYFAIFNVAVNTTLGFFPWIWGLGIDSLKGWNLLLWNHYHLNAYSLFYPLIAFMMLIAWILLRRVVEPKSLSTEEFVHELFVETPKLAMTRILHRKIFF